MVAFDSKRYVGAQIGIYNPAGEKVGKVSHLRNVEYVFVAGPTDKVEAAVNAARDPMAGRTERKGRPVTNDPCEPCGGDGRGSRRRAAPRGSGPCGRPGRMGAAVPACVPAADRVRATTAGGPGAGRGGGERDDGAGHGPDHAATGRARPASRVVLRDRPQRRARDLPRRRPAAARRTRPGSPRGPCVSRPRRTRRVPSSPPRSARSWRVPSSGCRPRTGTCSSWGALRPRRRAGGRADRAPPRRRRAPPSRERWPGSASSSKGCRHERHTHAGVGRRASAAGGAGQSIGTRPERRYPHPTAWPPSVRAAERLASPGAARVAACS